MAKTIRLSKMVNPHFYPLWRTDKPYIVAKGGRGSFKSSVISLKLVTMVKRWTQLNKKVNVVCILANKSDLHDTVYSQVIWALDVLDLADEYTYFKSPLRITHKLTGSTFYFYGADNPHKLKSNKVDNIIAVWFEEVANMKGVDVFDQSIPSFIRQKPPFVGQVKVFFSYNPPRNPFEWINEWVGKCKQDSNYFVDTSTYLDDELGFTTDQQLALIERYKQNDYDYYRWLYLGEVIGMGNNVYNMELFHPLKKLPSDDYITDVFYSVDTGHEVSATTCGAYGVTKRGDVILLDTYYYSPQGKTHKKPPSVLSKDLKHFIDKVTDWVGKRPTNMTIDSAEGALDNQFYNDFGIHWHKVAKLKKVDMIDRVQDLLAQGRFYYLERPENEIFLAEHRKYQWDDKTLQSDDPKVIKEDDHTCDMLQYFVRDNERFLGLKW
ncbi:PBSX family phage terminase large subunit [Lactobacillus alvi]|uniref:PBSX family phage terminase large subunit n=2 Tax=Limosilactobacillus alvi TaxID=990412 RepID=A0ABS2EP38_9LACO|nr:PBSX family phage terminase large subunit [Limosilactobacillus alvi]